MRSRLPDRRHQSHSDAAMRIPSACRVAYPLHMVAPVLRALVPLAALGLAGCLYPEGGDDDDGQWDCTDEASRRFEVTTPTADSQIQFRVDACRLDADACMSLCQLVLERVGMQPAVTVCDVTFTAKKAMLDVTYLRYSNACGSDDAVPLEDSPVPTGEPR